MTAELQVADLAILAADKDMESAVAGLLNRHHALHLRRVTFQSFTHPGHDPGCLNKAHEFLRPQCNRFRRAIVLFDFAGCGQERKEDAPTLEARVTRNLARSGWNDRAETVVIAPELEIWVWSDSPHVDSALGWSGRIPDLRTWLRQEAWLTPGSTKPARPKEAMKAALRFAQKPWSSAIFNALASRASLDHCSDASFLRLKGILQRWFGKGAANSAPNQAGPAACE